MPGTVPRTDLHYCIKHSDKEPPLTQRLSEFPFFTWGNPDSERLSELTQDHRVDEWGHWDSRSSLSGTRAMVSTTPSPGHAQWWEGRRPRVRRPINTPCVSCVGFDLGQRRGNADTGSEVWANKREDWTDFGRQFGEVVKALVFESDHLVF